MTFKNILYPNIHFTKKNQFPYLFFVKPKQMYDYSIKKEENYNYDIPLTYDKDAISIGQYSNIIKKIKEELAYGNVYQINFTMEKKINIQLSPLELYMQIRNYSEPRFGYYLDFSDYQVLSFSPEQFFQKIDNKIFSYPMKGTIQRSANKKKDQEYKYSLENSIKDKAEHLMIVDLIRNDLGKISQYGSVKVNNLYNVDSYKTVYQMVSEVEGMLKTNIKEKDIFQALFPGGSITGAPKESAMKIIDQLENYNRDIYTGTIGYIKSNGDMNFNMAIRTMTIKKSYRLNIQLVEELFGILKHKEEWDEAQLKSKILNI